MRVATLRAAGKAAAAVAAAAAAAAAEGNPGSPAEDLRGRGTCWMGTAVDRTWWSSQVEV